MEKREELGKALACLLGRWPKTVHQAMEWLEKRGTGEDEANRIIENLVNQGFLDDRLYARLFVEGHEGWGPLRLRQELKRRGISDRLVLEAIEEAYVPSAIEGMIRDWRKAGIDDRRIAGRLLRRGFPAGEISGALRSSCPGRE
jgi:regulatory protein